MLVNPSPFYLDDYKITGNFIYNWFSVILIQNLIFRYYFNFITHYNIIFHCLGHVIQCLCGNFWILAGPRSLEFRHLWAVINLAQVQETDAPTEVSEKAKSKLVIIFCEWGPLKGHYNLAASLKLPYGRWNGMYISAPWRIRIFLNSQCGICKSLPCFSLFLHILKCMDVTLACSET
jgi:hypothetical protein